MDNISQLPLNSLKLTKIDNDLTKIVLKIHPRYFLIIFAARIASVFLYEKYPTIRDLHYRLHFLERPRKFLSRLTARTTFSRPTEVGEFICRVSVPVRARPWLE